MLPNNFVASGIFVASILKSITAGFPEF